MLERLVEVELLDAVVDAEELDIAVTAFKTMNPGLDNSPLFGSKVEDDCLNRRTYFALSARSLSGIAIVHE